MSAKQGCEGLMKVLFVTAEVTPFSKVGGLADVAGALPKALHHLDTDIRVISPGYGTIHWENLTTKSEAKFDVNVGDKTFTATILRTTLSEEDTVPVYFIRNEKLFDRKGIYVDPKTGEGYADDDDRYLFFMRAVLQWIEHSDWTPDILHANDHQTGLLPAFLNEGYPPESSMRKIRSVYTIHNMGYQGIYPESVLEKTGIHPNDTVQPEAFEFFGKVNFMKAALLYADKINTVSPTYAKEIMSSEEFGFGLQDILSERKKDLSGILNGVDYREWSPETDELIPYNYSRKNIEGKSENRSELLRKNRLMAERTTPVIGMVTRLVNQKGLDLIDEALEELLELDMHLIVLGTGERRYHQMFEAAKKSFPEKVGINFAYNNSMAHLIEAGSDMFLMPSKYEPCGLNQMYSLRYGTIPIVHATGGLADTIRDYNPETHQGNGFAFREYSGDALLTAVKRAITTFRNKAQWKFLRDNAMRCDYSWEVSAMEYFKLYESTLGNRG